MSLLLRTAEPDRTSSLAAAVGALKRGQLVVLPTDTVYGVAADAFSPTAVAALLRAKGRGRDVPVPVLVGSWRALDGLAARPSPTVRRLVESFWPGPLTIVVKAVPTLAWDLGEGRGTVALRMPLHPVALDVLEETGPLAVSSANRHGEPPAADAAAAREALGDAVSVYLEAGPVAGGQPSTVVDCSGGTSVRPRLLRAGALPVARLREVVPDLEESPPPAEPPPPVESPPPAEQPAADGPGAG